jgi:hypothetical protein
LIGMSSEVATLTIYVMLSSILSAWRNYAYNFGPKYPPNIIEKEAREQDSASLKGVDFQ